ncbi:MAG: lamin tail domain-containing protein [Flavobacteriales bacterium]|nr:lamin tail domain-containing protein [Flavobacteriales bacterium]
MKRTLLFIGTIMATMTYAQDCSDLFISEYVEGWSNNKALEIYNPTASAIDLSEYMVIRYSNGATSATSANAVQLTGTIAPYDVQVAVLEKLDPNGTGQDAPVWDSLQVRADEYYCPDYNTSNAFYWNGNDAVALAKGDVANVGAAILVDLFGKIGEDPGDGWSTDFPYTGAGVVVTKDHSLIRKSTVLKGETNPGISFFDPLAEYDSIPAVIEIGGQTYGNWSSLGEHDCGCQPASTQELAKTKVSVFPNPTSGEFFVKGAYGDVVIVNALGQTVSTVENNSDAILSFDLGTKRGVYFVKMQDAAGNDVTKRVIVK